MDIYQAIKQLDSKYEDCVFKVRSIDKDDFGFEIDVFGVTPSIADELSDAFFDIEDAAEVDLALIPIFYTKKEMIDNYPSVAEEYRRKMLDKTKKRQAETLRSAGLHSLPPRCTCRTDATVNLSSFGAVSVLQEWGGGGAVEVAQVVDTTVRADSYALAA